MPLSELAEYVRKPQLDGEVYDRDRRENCRRLCEFSFLLLSGIAADAGSRPIKGPFNVENNNSVIK